jgi:uncharacterized protein (DUF2252 family)
MEAMEHMRISSLTPPYTAKAAAVGLPLDPITESKEPPAPVEITTITRGKATSQVEEAAALTPSILRSPAEGVRFCDHFNEGEHLNPAELKDKQHLMVSGPLKLARCMPALFMSDFLGPYSKLGALSDKPAPAIWIDGDAHLGNFGVVEGKDGHAVWGLNDYDMTCKGSPAMDLDRLAFSIYDSMREKGLSPEEASAVVKDLAHAYLKEMKEISNEKEVHPAYLDRDETKDAIYKMVDKADDVKRPEFIKKYAEEDDKGWHFVYSEKVEPLDLATSNKVIQALHDYDATQGSTPLAARPLHIFGVANKLQSGGSSHGQPRFFALVENKNPDKPPVLMEIKQELPPPLAGWKGGNFQQAALESAKLWTGDLTKADSKQIVAGQTAMGANFNPFTGYTSIDGISYLVREREPCKATLSEKHMATVEDFDSLAKQAGKALARAHGRSSEDAGKILAWAGDKNDFSSKLDAFAAAYTKQAAADCAAYQDAHPESSPKAAASIPDTED